MIYVFRCYIELVINLNPLDIRRLCINTESDLPICLHSSINGQSLIHARFITNESFIFYLFTSLCLFIKKTLLFSIFFFSQSWIVSSYELMMSLSSTISLMFIEYSLLLRMKWFLLHKSKKTE